MGFVINSKSCGDFQMFLAKKGCKADTFRTFKGVLVVGSNFTLNPEDSRTLLQQIKEAQYKAPNERVYFIPFQNVSSVSGGDLRTTARADGFPTSIAENVPVIGASLSTAFKTIYTHKQLRKLNNRNVKFYALTENNLVLGETDSTGKLLPASGLLWRYLFMPQADGGEGGESADLSLYYENPNSLGDDIAFAELPSDVNLDKELQQIAELTLIKVSVPEAKTIGLKLILTITGEDVTANIGDVIASNSLIKVQKAGTVTDVTNSIDYSDGIIKVEVEEIGFMSVALAEPQAFIDAEVCTIDEGSYAAESITVNVA